MSIFRRKKQTDAEAESLKSFLDMIAPSIVKFETGYYICGNTFRCIWALREYPTSTDDLAILRHLGEKHGVTLHIYTRMVSPLEERKIVHNAEIRNRMNRGSSQDLQRSVEAESNLQDVANLIGSLHRNKEPLLHCAVYIEMIAGDMQELQILQTNVEVELMRSKLNVDRLKLRQQAGFCAVSPVGYNAFGTEYERVLPASSVANLFPFNYSGKTDRKGFYIGKDKYGSNIVVDFDQRDEDKTSANVLILGNSGQGKSYLMKLLLLNFLEAGKLVITLDVEHEQWELCQALGGCFADIIEGTYKINLLEPRCWDTDADPYDVDAPKAFRQSTRLAQHLFLRRIQAVGERSILDATAIERDLQHVADLLALHIVIGIDIQCMVVFIGFHKRAERFVDVETRNDIKIQYSVIQCLDAILEIKIPRGELARCGQFLTLQPIEEDAPAVILGNLSLLKGRFRSCRYVIHRVGFPAVHDVERRKRPRIKVQLKHSADLAGVLHAVLCQRMERLAADLFAVVRCFKETPRWQALSLLEIIMEPSGKLQKLHAGFVLQIDFRAVLRDVKARHAHTCASDFFCGLRTGLSCVQSLMYSCTAAGTTFS